MSDESTASLRIKYESIGHRQVMQEKALIKAASADMARSIVANSAIVRRATLADIAIEKTERVSAIRTAAQVQVTEVRKAASLEIIERKKAAAEAIAIERAKAYSIARESAKANQQTRVGLGFMAGQGISVGGLASVSTGAAAAVATAYAVKNVTSDLVQEAAKWEKMAIALGDIESSGERAKKVIGDLYELAKRPGIGLKEAEQTYIQFRALNMDGEKALRVIKAVSNAVALSGGGATEFERVNYQITQMLSKGKVLEEDLRIMRNSLPRLTVAMREAFGTTTAEGIRNAGVNAEQFLAGIVAQFEKLPTATQTLESELENAATAMSKFKAAFVNTQAVKDWLRVATHVIEKLTKIKEHGTGAASNNFLTNLILTGTFTGENVASRFRNPTAQVGGGLTSDEMIKNWEKKQAEQKKEVDKANKEAERKRKEFEDRLRKFEDRLRNSPEAKAGAQMLQRGKALGEDWKKEEDDQIKEAFELDRKRIADKEEADRKYLELVDKVTKEDEAKEKDRLAALQELREAEAGEYQLRLIQIETWGEQMKARVGDDESAITRIMEEQGFRRKMVYADAWGQILGGSSSFFGSMAALSKQYNEDNTREYAKWVAISQGLAIAEATLNIGVAMAKAMKSGFTTLDGLAQMAVVASAGGQILNSIASMNAAKVGKGAFDKGGSLGYGEFGIAGENGPEIITGPARIASTRDSARILGAKSSLSVNVHNYASAQVDVQQRDDGSIDVIVNKMASQIEERLASGVATGTGVLNRAVVGAYGLRRNGR